MLPVFAHIHRPLRLKAAKEREQATTSPLNLPRSSFAAAVAAKKAFCYLTFGHCLALSRSLALISAKVGNLPGWGKVEIDPRVERRRETTGMKASI